MKDRIYLSPPNISDQEQSLVERALQGGWVAPVGPELDAFEETLEDYYKKKVLALNSGTSALHLALVLAGISDGEEVVVSSFTFAACANVVLYERAIPVFIDSEAESWNMDPELLRNYLDNHPPPRAVIVTHLYGIAAKIDEIRQICREHDVVLIEDAAEAVGSTYAGQPVGTFGDFGIVSFNGNKIVTTGGGGALICNQAQYDLGHYLATQANSGSFGYEHAEVGYNYRLSNVLAAVGLAQWKRLDQFVQKKREIFDYYEQQLSDVFEFIPEPKNATSNRWLTTPLIKEEQSFQPADLIQFVDQRNIESRRLWKPLPLHHAYEHAPAFDEGVCTSLYERGLCLPSGTGLTKGDLERVVHAIKAFLEDQ